MKPIALRVYQSSNGKAPFADWFHALDTTVRVKISAALFQMEEGNFSGAKFLRKGIWEQRIHSGPGYRIYFAKEGDSALILLSGGSKRTQSMDIRRALAFWADYKTAVNDR